MRSMPLAATLTLGLCVASPVWPQAGLLVPTDLGHPDATVLSLREMHVDVGLARGYARVNVLQIFENHTGDIQEGTYRFALPPSAAVGDFAVWDGQTRIPGVILEKERARAIYRELTTQRIDPGLLQQGEEDEADDGSGPGAPRPSGGALFSVRVAPIPAWATKRLEIQFQQDLPVVNGTGELRLVLRPPEGEPPIAGLLRVAVQSEEGRLSVPPGALPLESTSEGKSLTLDARRRALDTDLVVRVDLGAAPALSLATFRNPEGRLPDGVALAPWERPGEIPLEKDGFFLLLATPPAARGTDQAARGPIQRAPVELAVVFDTSLSHRWSGLEAAYGQLVRVLHALDEKDRFSIVAFDDAPYPLWQGARPATGAAVEEALGALRARTLGAGTQVLDALAAAREIVGGDGRVLLLTDGAGELPSSRQVVEVLDGRPLFTSLTGVEASEALRGPSTMTIQGTSASVETDLFFERLLAPIAAAPAQRKKDGAPFRVTMGDPGLRDVHAVLAHPMSPGALSGWVGRYARPVADLLWELPVPEGDALTLEHGLPERDLSARDLPRRWARAHVDHLLRLIEAEGERREWVDEIIALSKRYKFVTPYTAFLAAPRSLLRPRRIQPGDPVLRVECDPSTTRAVALLPFGLRLPLARRPGTRLWEGRFLAPDDLADGRYPVRILLTDASGAVVAETKHFTLDGTRPTIHPEPPDVARAGERLRIAARADSDVVVLTARLGNGPPVPLRWDDTARRNVGMLPIPRDARGDMPLFFEAIDGAKNHGFASTSLEVVP